MDPVMFNLYNYNSKATQREPTNTDFSDTSLTSLSAPNCRSFIITSLPYLQPMYSHPHFTGMQCICHQSANAMRIMRNDIVKASGFSLPRVGDARHTTQRRSSSSSAACFASIAPHKRFPTRLWICHLGAR